MVRQVAFGILEKTSKRAGKIDLVDFWKNQRADLHRVLGRVSFMFMML